MVVFSGDIYCGIHCLQYSMMFGEWGTVGEVGGFVTKIKRKVEMEGDSDLKRQREDRQGLM